LNDFEEYSEASDNYLANALDLLRRGEEQKAGELLWGAIAEAVKALAATRDESPVRHKDLVKFVRAIALDVNDERIWELFRAAQDLHDNFYDRELEPGAVASYVPKVEELRSKLASMLPKGAPADLARQS
jgi:hypothetical protein